VVASSRSNIRKKEGRVRLLMHLLPAVRNEAGTKSVQSK
jgi:hypothetical protein